MPFGLLQQEPIHSGEQGRIPEENGLYSRGPYTDFGRICMPFQAFKTGTDSFRGEPDPHKYARGEGHDKVRWISQDKQ